MNNCGNHILGVDPGLTGAIALLNPSGELITLDDMPVMRVGKKNQVDPWGVAQVVRQNLALSAGNVSAIVEKVGAMPNQGTVSMFNFGFSVGVIHGALAMGDIDFKTITPQAWKKRAGLIGSEKDASRLLAQAIYPTAELNLKKHHGRADALLIANWQTLVKYGGDYVH